MNKRIILSSLLALAFVVTPRTSQARWLDVNNGRFLTMDSYEGSPSEPQSLHKYTYAHNNPVNLTDPSGLVVKHAGRDLADVAVGTHQFIILIPDNPADFLGTTPGAAALSAVNAQMKTIGGKQVIVVGAHNTGRLTVKWFEKSDELATRELIDPNYSVPWYESDFDAEGHDIAPPSGRNDTQFITDILNAIQNYIGNENVVNIPYPSSGGGFSPLAKSKYNSNAWATSVIGAVGATPWPDFNGYDVLGGNRIPAGYFTRGGIKPGAPLGSPSRITISNAISIPVPGIP